MSKEKVELQLKFTPNYKKYSILLNCYRVGGMKWNDVEGAIFHKIDLSKEDVLFALGVKQQIADLEAKLAESDEYRELLLEEKAGYLDLISGYADKCKQLEQQLKETDKLMQEYLSKCLSLEQQLAEERKKVVQEIRDLAGDYFEMPYCDACGNTDFNDVVLTGKDLTEILDDVERGE